MKLERLHEYVMTTVVIAIGLALAIVFGKTSGEGQEKMVLWVTFGVLSAVACLTLRTNVWILISLTALLDGQLLILPVPIAAKDLIILTVCGMCLAMKAVKLLRLKPVMDMLDFWLIINVLYIVSAFIRHPVGSLAAGSARVGGRPYFSIFTATIAYWVFSRSVCQPKTARWLPAAMVGIKWLESGISMLCNRFWVLGGLLGSIYSSFAVDTKLTYADVYGPGGGGEDDPRQVALMVPGQSLGMLLGAYFSPLTLFNPIYIFRFLMMLIALGLIFLSGFRSALFSVFTALLVASYYRRGWPAVLRIGIIVIPGVLMLGFLQGTVIDLPMPAQRALSYLPGNWSEAARADARNSTKWRTDMWKDALFTDKYIKDKVFGDGFGVSYAQMDRIMALQASLITANSENGQESFAILGGFHSGPVSSIRFVGYVGLGLFLVFLIQSARVAHRLLVRARGTPFQAFALYFGIPIVFRPLFFVFIFGGYGEDATAALVGVGMLKLLSNSLDAYERSLATNKMSSEWSVSPVRKSVLRPYRPQSAPIT